ncbi:MAG: hypothetical protein UHX00_01260 [Caryophanon sp.]|nr:hypothetical protein [Caryophanon sp.]
MAEGDLHVHVFFSEDSFEQLQQLSDCTATSKANIIRLLLYWFRYLVPTEQELQSFQQQIVKVKTLQIRLHASLMSLVSVPHAISNTVYVSFALYTALQQTKHAFHLSKNCTNSYRTSALLQEDLFYGLASVTRETGIQKSAFISVAILTLLPIEQLVLEHMEKKQIGFRLSSYSKDYLYTLEQQSEYNVNTIINQKVRSFLQEVTDFIV